MMRMSESFRFGVQPNPRAGDWPLQSSSVAPARVVQACPLPPRAHKRAEEGAGMVDGESEDRAGNAADAAGRATAMARIALIVAAIALALSILGLFLPI
jgi:hypothetical protein